jgi:hypothetical protein
LLEAVHKRLHRRVRCLLSLSEAIDPAQFQAEILQICVRHLVDGPASPYHDGHNDNGFLISFQAFHTKLPDLLLMRVACLPLKVRGILSVVIRYNRKRRVDQQNTGPKVLLPSGTGLFVSVQHAVFADSPAGDHACHEGAFVVDDASGSV